MWQYAETSIWQQFYLWSNFICTEQTLSYLESVWHKHRCYLGSASAFPAVLWKKKKWWKLNVRLQTFSMAAPNAACGSRLIQNKSNRTPVRLTLSCNFAGIFSKASLVQERVVITQSGKHTYFISRLLLLHSVSSFESVTLEFVWAFFFWQEWMLFFFF